MAELECDSRIVSAQDGVAAVELERFTGGTTKPLPVCFVCGGDVGGRIENATDSDSVRFFVYNTARIVVTYDGEEQPLGDSDDGFEPACDCCIKEAKEKANGKL